MYLSEPMTVSTNGQIEAGKSKNVINGYIYLLLRSNLTTSNFANETIDKQFIILDERIISVNELKQCNEPIKSIQIEDLQEKFGTQIAKSHKYTFRFCGVKRI